MATRDVVTIGASAGGISTLEELISKLSKDIPASIVIAQHLHPRSPSVLDHIIQRSTTLPVKFATDGEAMHPGHVYIAPPDFHVLVEPGYLRVVRGPRENRARPAVDPLFRSAAWSYGPRVVGVVLSGTLDDGASGLWAIRSCGGITIVQDPSEALHSEMPTSALMALNVDHVAPIETIALLLEDLARTPIDGASPSNRPATLGQELAAATREKDTNVEDMNRIGKPAGFACPACQGGLWELTEGELVTYRCHIGHAYGPESLQAAQGEETERALETALRALEDQGAAARRLSTRFEQRVPALALRYETQAAGLEEQSGVIRKLLRNGRRIDD